ncbi:MAG: hypothetical protein AAGI08_00190 [Bacteroidota bacterium]
MPTRHPSEPLAFYGGAVKAVKSDDGHTGTLSGYLVKYGAPDERDFDGQYFSAETYYGAHKGNGVDTVFHHGLPVKGYDFAAQIGFMAPVKTTVDEVGLFSEVVLDLRKQYEAALFKLAEDGSLGWSSGSAGHLVKIGSDGHIKTWPIIEASLTPTPSNPRSTVVPVKSLLAAEEPALKAALSIEALTGRVYHAVYAYAVEEKLEAWVQATYPFDAPPRAVVELWHAGGLDLLNVPLSFDGDPLDSETTITVAPREQWTPAEAVTEYKSASRPGASHSGLHQHAMKAARRSARSSTSDPVHTSGGATSTSDGVEPGPQHFDDLKSTLAGALASFT